MSKFYFIILLSVTFSCRNRKVESTQANFLEEASNVQMIEEWRARALDILAQLRNLPLMKQNIFEPSEAGFRDEILVQQNEAFRADHKCQFWEGKGAKHPAKESYSNFLCRFEEAISTVKIVGDQTQLRRRAYGEDEKGNISYVGSSPAEAVYDFNNNTIYVDLLEWFKTTADVEERLRQNRGKHYLVFHEYLRALGKDDDPGSSGLWRLSSQVALRDFPQSENLCFTVREEEDFLTLLYRYELSDRKVDPFIVARNFAILSAKEVAILDKERLQQLNNYKKRVVTRLGASVGQEFLKNVALALQDKTKKNFATEFSSLSCPPPQKLALPIIKIKVLNIRETDSTKDTFFHVDLSPIVSAPGLHYELRNEERDRPKHLLSLETELQIGNEEWDKNIALIRAWTSVSDELLRFMGVLVFETVDPKSALSPVRFFISIQNRGTEKHKISLPGKEVEVSISVE